MQQLDLIDMPSRRYRKAGPFVILGVLVLSLLLSTLPADAQELPSPSTGASAAASPPPVPTTSDPAPQAPATSPQADSAPDHSAAKSTADIVVPEGSKVSAATLQNLKNEMGTSGASMGQGLKRIQNGKSVQDATESTGRATAGTVPLAAARVAPAASARVMTLASTNSWTAPGVQGMDVSGHQQDVDWQSQWDMGARFVYIKATEGMDFMSPTFGSQYNGSADQGMIRGGYHFALPSVSSGAVQANYFLARGGGWSADGKTLPPLLDIEYNPYSSLGNSCYNMSGSAMVKWIKDFSETVLARTGRVPAIYTTTDWWSTCTGNDGSFGDNPLHVAAYSKWVGHMPNGWSVQSIWQYSSEGPFDGDSNAWNGDYAALQRFARNGTVPAAPAIKTDTTSRLVGPGDFNGDGVADLIQRKANGELWFYAGNGAGQFSAGRMIGDGWEIYDQIIGVGDYNGDGKNDLVARKTDGSLWFYAGTGSVSDMSEGYLGGTKIGDFGWDSFDTILGAGDFNGDKKADLLARKPDGTLWLYSGTGSGKAGSSQQIDFGWQVFDQIIAVRDFDGDGTNDLAGRKPDGSLWFYSNKGNATLVKGRQIGTGWNIYSDIQALGDTNADGKPDLAAMLPDGSVYFYAGTWMRDDGYTAGAKIGNFGWEAFDLTTGVKDFNGDGRNDLIARKPDGTLWFYPGNGAGGYGSSQKIGDYGWDSFDALVGTGDFNGDGKNDLIARKPDGTLWLYAGTGKINGTNNGYLGAQKIGNFGWDAFSSLIGFGDYNKDGKNDILACQPDGTLSFYAGNGAGNVLPGQRVGAGWNAFTDLTAVGDLNSDGKPDLIARKRDGSLWRFNGTGMPANEGYRGRTLAIRL